MKRGFGFGSFSSDPAIVKCRRVAGVRADGPDVVWVEHDSDSTVSYVRGIRGEPRDFLRTRDVLTWSVRSPAWHWSAVDIDYANRKLYLADKADRFGCLSAC